MPAARRKAIAPIGGDERRGPPVSALMRGLAEYISGALGKPLPATVAERTRHHLLDTMAAMISGTRLPAGRHSIAYAALQGGTRQACIAGTRIVTSVPVAAMANGMLAHADETDDSHAPSLTHPGCSIVSAALAMAEARQNSGTELLRAVALGYDISTRISISLEPMRFRADGHSNMGFGPMFGAAAAAGALAHLSPRAIRHMLSYAAQQAAGVASYMRDTGHVEKAFAFGGMPARNGVTAAAMVAHGFTGVEDVFAGERNFFAAYNRQPQPAEILHGMGTSYQIMNTNIKRWSVGGPIQAALDSLLALMHAHAITHADVKQLVVRVSRSGANTVGNRAMPNVCMEHMCAIMLLDGNVTFTSSHDQRRMQARDVLALRRRILLQGDDDLERALPSRQAIVEVTTYDERRFTHHTRAVRGTRYDPMTRAEIGAKAFDLVTPVLGTRRAHALCDAIWNIECIEDMRKLRPLLMNTTP